MNGIRSGCVFSPGTESGSPKGAWNSHDFVDSLRDSREVWYDGSLIEVTESSVTSGIIATLGRLYDLQHDGAHSETTTLVSPDSGVRVSRSYQLPDSRKALAEKWLNSHWWMEASLGQLPRAPDFMANVVVGLYDFRHELSRLDPMFGRNAERYYVFCRDNDRAVTHAIGDPQIDRSSSPSQDPDLALRVVSRSQAGIVVRGAKQLATLAPVSHEVLVYMSPSYALRDRPEHVVWFALPLASPGLKILCRESLVRRDSSHFRTLANAFDEQDSMLFFDNVFVPWERVFLLGDAALAFDGFFRLNAWALYVGLIRFHHRLRILLAVATMCAEAIGTDKFRDVENKLGELASYAEMSGLALAGLGAQAYRTPSGLWAPGQTFGADVFAAQTGARANAIVREIAASGLVMQPSAKDLAAPGLRAVLDKYMRGKERGADAKARLFRLAWELAGDSYGMRQEIYERWNRGDIVRNRAHLLKTFDNRGARARVEAMLAGELP